MVYSRPLEKPEGSSRTLAPWDGERVERWGQSSPRYHSAQGSAAQGAMNLCLHLLCLPSASWSVLKTQGQPGSLEHSAYTSLILSPILLSLHLKESPHPQKEVWMESREAEESGDPM